MIFGVGRVGINRATRRDRWCCLFKTDFEREKTASKKTRGMKMGNKSKWKKRKKKWKLFWMEWKVKMAEKQSKTLWITAKHNYQKRSENACSGFATPIHCSRCGRTLRPGARRRNDTRFRVLNTWTGTLPLSSFPTTVGENPMCTRYKGFMCFGTWTRPKKAWIVASKTVGNRHGFTMFWEWWYFEVWQGPKNEIANHLSHQEISFQRHSREF